jgi:REP element-mobilizing transposase RayT
MGLGCPEIIVVGARYDGYRHPQPLLEDWCRRRMVQAEVVLSTLERDIVRDACEKHSLIRNWHIHTVNARSNHVHIVISASTHEPQIVRDQLKANATRLLRESGSRTKDAKIWTRGGDCDLIDTEEELYNVSLYVSEAQHRMGIE